MSKNSRRYRQKVDIRSLDESGEFLDDDLDLDDLSRDIYSTEWGNEEFDPERVSARRKIERRQEMKRLYSQLQDWEEFGLEDNYL